MLRAVPAPTQYVTQNAIDPANPSAAYHALATLFMHLALMQDQRGIIAVLQLFQILPNNTVRLTMADPLPLDAAQLAHLGIS
jgi:hypothetical protein